MTKSATVLGIALALAVNAPAHAGDDRWVDGKTLRCVLGLAFAAAVVGGVSGGGLALWTEPTPETRARPAATRPAPAVPPLAMRLDLQREELERQLDRLLEHDRNASEVAVLFHRYCSVMMAFRRELGDARATPQVLLEVLTKRHDALPTPSPLRAHLARYLEEQFRNPRS